MGPQVIKRNFSIDMLRVVSMLSIVAIHVFCNMKDSFDENTLKWVNGYIQVTNFAVPVFFMISGFVMADILTSKDKHQLKYTASKTLKIYKIFLIWSLIYLVFKNDFNIQRIYWTVNKISISNLFCGAGFSEHLWFLPVLCVGYFAIYTVSRYYNKLFLLFFTAGVYIFLGLFSGYYREILNIFSKPINNNYFVGISYCFSGLFLARNKEILIKYSRYTTGFMVIGYFMVILESTFLFNNAAIVRPDFLIGTFFYSIGIFCFFNFFKFSFIEHNRFFAKIAKFSLGIYLIHPLIIYYLKFSPIEKYLTGYNPIVRFHIFYFITIIFSFLSVWGIQKTSLRKII